MAKHIDLLGRRFGKLLVVEKLPERQDRYTTWRCRCDCGGEIIVNKGFAKVSIVGAGMQSHSGVASTMFEALFNQNINIHMISTSEIKISVVIDEQDADKAVAAIHDAFIN